MKRFLIHVSTHWCGEEDTFRAVAMTQTKWKKATGMNYGVE